MGLFQPNPPKELWVPLQLGQGGTAANNGYFNIRPWQNVNSAAASYPAWVRKLRLQGLMTAFTTNPIANTFQVSFLPYNTTVNAAFGTPNGSETVANLNAVQNYTNGSNVYRYYFTSTYEYVLPANSVSDAQISGFSTVLIRLKNTTGGSLTQTGDNWFGGMLVAYE